MNSINPKEGPSQMSIVDAIAAGVASAPSTDRPAGIELIQDLAPAAGMPVFPPSVEGRAEIHPRTVEGQVVDVIELDSTGSAANRIEECLRTLYDAGEYPLPVTATTLEAGDREIKLTTLDCPHRSFDAWIRYSVIEDGKTHFEDSPLGHELSLSRPDALDALLEVSAHDALFGVWDSHRTGPQGQLRIARALTSTLIGINPKEQASFAARTDPVNLSDKMLDEKLFGKKLSELGLSSIPPQKQIPYEEDAKGSAKKFGASKVGHRGGVSIDSARYQAFVSFPALRRLGFQRYDSEGVRTALTWLAIYGLLLRCAEGWDLRSRCVLYPTSAATVNVVGSDGSREAVKLDLKTAKSEFESAVAKLKIDDRSPSLTGGKNLQGIIDKALKASE